MLNEIVALLLQVLNALGVVVGLTKNAAQEHLDYNIESIVTASALVVENPTYGNAGLYTQEATNFASLVTALSGISAQITAYTPVPTVVSLPPIAPTGYGGDSASAVWSYTMPGAGLEQGQYMVIAGASAQYQGGNNQTERPSNYAPGYLLSGDWGSPGQPDPSISGITIVDLTTIMLTDATYADWITRVYGGLFDGFDGYGRATKAQSSSSWNWTLFFGPDEFVLYKAAKFGAGAIAAPLAPVWPGLALVTLGTPVAISTAFTIVAPLDGVIVDLTGEPSKSSFFSFDGINSYRNLGALSFTTDDGDQEAAQSLGFTSGIYTPRVMSKAAGVKVRTVGGVSGTVTPWVIT